MDASIIIVSWNTKELLKTCLNGLLSQKGCELEVFVVDNNSQDGTQQMLRNEFPNVKSFFNSQNRGFACANNQALQIAQGDYLILVNSDIEFIQENTIQKIIAFQKSSGAGIVGCKLLNTDGSDQPSVRSFPSFISQFLLLLKIHIIFPHLKTFSRYLMKNFDYSKTSQVDQVSGALFSISRACYSAVGKLDEAFWIWFEEVDYCKRAKGKDFSVMYFAETHVIHYGGQSFQKIMPVSRQKRFNTSLMKYAAKYYPRWQRVLLHIASPLSLMLARLTPSRKRLRSYK